MVLGLILRLERRSGDRSKANMTDRVRGVWSARGEVVGERNNERSGESAGTVSCCSS